MGADRWAEDELPAAGTPRDPAVHDLAAHRGKVKGQELIATRFDTFPRRHSS